MSEAILKRIDHDHFLELRFSQPNRRNPMDQETARLFQENLKLLASEQGDRCRPLVIRGEEGTFSAGGDFGFLKERKNFSLEENEATMLAFYNSFLSVLDYPGIVVAFIEGAAIGAGLCLAMACDEIWVEGKAKLALNFLKLGINPGMAALPLARERLGISIANDVLISGERFSGEDFYDWGGANRLFQESSEAWIELESALKAYPNSRFAVAPIKSERKECLQLEGCLKIEAKGQALCYHSSAFESWIKKMESK